MFKKVLMAVECQGLGDIISSTPAIRTMSELTYREKVSVATHMPEFYKNLPYIDQIFHISDDFEGYHVIRTFNIEKIKKYDIMHEKTDIRQFHSLCCGFMLLPVQMTCDYIPEPYEEIDLPDDYVVIHATQTWPSRTWESSNWQELANKLDMPIVNIGKTDNDAPDCLKPVFKMENTIDLTNQLSLSQCWHVLDKAKIVVTMDSGILHLAGTTDTHIVQLGSSIHPYYRAPYRQGMQQHKYDYVKGDCSLFCASSMAYMFQNIPFKIGKCAEQYETFECHPPVEKVLEKVSSIYNKL